MAHPSVGLLSALMLIGAAGAASPGVAAEIAPIRPGGGFLPAVPTTRILAIGHLTAKANMGVMRAAMPGEVAATVRLYLCGKIDSWYVRQDKPGVVFVMNASTTAEAHDMLEKLPLGVAGLMEFDLIPLGPLAPLGLLADRPAKN